MKHLALVFVSYLFLASCSGKLEAPDDVISESVMSKIVLDLTMVDASYQVSQSKPEIPKFKKELFYEEVMKKHGVKRDQFIRSLDYYAQNTKQLQAIYEEAQKNLSQKQAETLQ